MTIQPRNKVYAWHQPMIGPMAPHTLRPWVVCHTGSESDCYAWGVAQGMQTVGETYLHSVIKRQSTTSKVTANLVRLIAQHCANGDGVIVRYKGKEYGVVGYNPFNGQFMTIEGTYLVPALCTVRKGLPSAWDRQALLNVA